MKKSILTLLFGTFVFGLYLVLAIKSYSYYSDEYGTDISVDGDCVTLALIGLFVAIVGIVMIVRAKKDLTVNVNQVITVIGFVMTFYPLGLAFKMLAKKKPESSIDYFLWAIFGAFMLAYGVIDYIDGRKKLDK